MVGYQHFQGFAVQMHLSTMARALKSIEISAKSAALAQNVRTFRWKNRNPGPGQGIVTVGGGGRRGGDGGGVRGGGEGDGGRGGGDGRGRSEAEGGEVLTACEAVPEVRRGEGNALNLTAARVDHVDVEAACAGRPHHAR